eukprot:1160031-Pelagomonas_calceolata.AAC.2
MDAFDAGGHHICTDLVTSSEEGVADLAAATKYHPDKVKGSEQDKAAGAEKFKEIGEAYGRSFCLEPHAWGAWT